MHIFKKFFTSSTKTANNKIVILYTIFRIIVVFNLVNEIMFTQRWGDIFTLILTLALFKIPQFTERLFNIEIPNLLELIIILFIFSSTILGELGDFYGYFKLWDTILHTINGFLASGVGFSLIYLLNKNTKGMNLNPLFLAIVTFCFSMTIGVLWELIEYSADRWIDIDMQKDRIIQEVNSVSIGEEKNTVHNIKNIEETVIESQDEFGNNIETVIDGGYLDVGINDTMKDLFVNLLGAFVFSIFSYLYTRYDKKKYRFVKKFILKKGNKYVETGKSK